jgi:hypothetical protein
MFPWRGQGSFFGRVYTLGLFHGLFCRFDRKVLGFLFVMIFRVKACSSSDL